MSMAENTENRILEHLRNLRNDVLTLRAEMHEGFNDLKLRVSSLEEHTAGLRRDLALIHGDIANIHQRLDHHEKRLERIERRLELTEDALKDYRTSMRVADLREDTESTVSKMAEFRADYNRVRADLQAGEDRPPRLGDRPRQAGNGFRPLL